MLARRKAHASADGTEMCVSSASRSRFVMLVVRRKANLSAPDEKQPRRRDITVPNLVARSIAVDVDPALDSHQRVHPVAFWDRLRGNSAKALRHHGRRRRRHRHHACPAARKSTRSGTERHGR